MVFLSYHGERTRVNKEVRKTKHHKFLGNFAKSPLLGVPVMCVAFTLLQSSGKNIHTAAFCCVIMFLCFMGIIFKKLDYIFKKVQDL